MSRICTLVLLASIAVSPAAVGNPTVSISFEFPVVDMDARERRTLERYLRRPGTFGCDLVKFPVGDLIELIDTLDKNRLAVEDSAVRIKVFGADLGEFQGIHFELGRERETPGPYSWGGVLRDNPEVTVGFFADRYHIGTMFLRAGDVVYRTHVSLSSGNYFLCKTDGTRPPKRID